MEMLKQCSSAANEVKAQAFTRPITLDDVAKSKAIFDFYIRLKAAAYVQDEISKGNIQIESAAGVGDQPT